MEPSGLITLQRKLANASLTFAPCPSAADLDAFEQLHQVSLPPEYRFFLAHIGNGGALLVTGPQRGYVWQPSEKGIVPGWSARFCSGSARGCTTTRPRRPRFGGPPSWVPQPPGSRLARLGRPAPHRPYRSFL